jgi:protein SCO1/2
MSAYADQMRRLVPVLAAAGIVLAGCGGSGSSAGSTSVLANAAKPKDPSGVKYAAPGELTPVKQAPDFTLRDSLGKKVSLSDFRGKAVALTFIYDHCPDVCPLIVGNLHAAQSQLGPQASKLQVVAVSVDPRGDTPKTDKAFLKAHDMTGRMEYLLGSRAQLEAVWKKYGIAATGSPDDREVSHSALVYGITGSGKITTLYPANFKPRWIAHDVPLLAAH